MKSLLAALTVVTSLAAAQAHGASYSEAGDAGETVATAQAAGSGGSALTQIFGSLASTTDADLYQIYVSNPASFSISAVDTSADEALDTDLFLLTTTGVGIATNDDGSNTSINAAIPAGYFSNLSPGYYLLGISNSSNEPVNLNSQLIFMSYTDGDSTSIRGPASGVNPNTEATFDGFQNSSDNGPGTYRIDLTGVTGGPVAVSAAPEAGDWALVMAGIGAIGLMLRRRGTVICGRPLSCIGGVGL